MFVIRRRRQARDERGAVAILVALLTVALFGAGAIAVDLGNAYARARSQQTRADLAALSAGGLLPANDSTKQTAVAQKIADYLNNPDNWIQDGSAGSTPHTWTASELLSSGAVTFPTANGDRVVFKAPGVRVDFSLGRDLGLSNTTVSRQATVGVFSISENVVAPLYAVQGCDYGSQVLKDAPNGQTVSAIPALDYTAASDKNNQISLTFFTPTSVTENQAPAPTLTLTGAFDAGTKTKPSLIDSVGFFRDNTGPAPATVQATPTAVTATSATVVVPAQVLANTGFWFVRVHESGGWTNASLSNVLVVGTAATPTCPAASAGGNFGQLDFGDQSNPNADITQVFKTGPTKNIVAYPGSPTPGGCDGLPAPALIYDGTVDNANCVNTAPGFKPNAATDGLVKDSDARLNKDTTPACGASRGTVGGFSINNDYLSCFLTNPGTTLGQIESSGYAGPAVLSSAIVKSPRFFFVPVFSTEPDTGKKAYKIVAFRPAFLTDQPTSATKSTGPTSTGPNSANGITIGSNGKVQSLNFILFNPKALPDYLDSGLPTSPTYVFGPKVIKLIN